MLQRYPGSAAGPRRANSLSVAERGKKPPHGKDDSAAPVSYGGTQVNIYGQPEAMRGIMGGSAGVLHSDSMPSLPQTMGTYPYGYAYPPNGFTPNQGTQLGLVTEHMLRRLDESRLYAMTELIKRTTGPTGPHIEEVTTPKDGKAHPFSPGNGDWKGQIQHIYAHLMGIAEEDKNFRSSIGEPEMGEITGADLEEDETSYTLALRFSKKRPTAVRRRSLDDQSKGYRKTEKSKEPEEDRRKKEEPQYEKENYQQEGTLRPAKPFNAESDVEILRKAMKGLGTDEDAISNIMGKRTFKQRFEIMKQFKTMFGKDLVKEFKSELSGDFWKVVRGLCFAPPEFDASELKNAVKGLGTDDDCVIEIICTRNNQSLKQMKEAYKRFFNTNVENDIADDTSGHYQNLLIALLQANRDEADVVDMSIAKKDAKMLYEAGERKFGTDESRFNAVLVGRSYAHLRATFKFYEKMAGHSIEEAIRKEMSSDLQSGMLTIVQCVQNKSRYFARKLHRAMKGAGTDDDTIVRIIVTRCEVDMVQIKQEFQKEFKQSLAQYIQDDTSGDYRKILLNLIGEVAATSTKKSSKSSRD